jgi:hypothetical protein
MSEQTKKERSMMSKAKPENPPKKTIDRFAKAATKNNSVTIDREGGKFGAGVIRRLSLATVGEALGHNYWLDQTTLEQVTQFANAAGDKGIKSRFTHPGMSSDGMGRHLGRLLNVTHEGDQVFGDLHFVESAHSTPDGDLAEYVMQLATEDPTAAGLSIVFHHDFEAEESFQSENTNGRSFKSPDPSNINSYPHVRMSELRAADMVDEPAANPSGMFDSESLPRDVDDLLSYAAGITQNKPLATAFGVDGDRASQFLGRWLESHGLSLSKKEADVANEISADEKTTPQPTREDFAAELNKFTAKFGAENGAKWFGENKSFAEALELHCEALTGQLSAANEKADSAEKRLASLALGEKEPVATGTTDSEKGPKKFAEVVTAKLKS